MARTGPVERRMRLSFPKMSRGFPEAQASIPPRLPREPPSHTASPSGDKLLLAVSQRCFSSLNGVKLFLNPKEYDPEGNGACSSDEMHNHETPEAALPSLAHPVRVNSRPTQLITLETVLRMLFIKQITSENQLDHSVT